MTNPKQSDGASRIPGRPSPERHDERPGTSTRVGSPDERTKFLVFVRKMVKYFKDVGDPDKSTAFMHLAKAAEQKKVSRPCMISQVKELFRGHKEMLILFNEILSPEFKILFKEDVPEIRDLAKLYVDKVKMRSSPAVFSAFMHILYLYKERALTSDEVDQEVEVLFAKACDLLEEYDCLRPHRAAPDVPSPLHPRHSDLEVSELQRDQQRERLRRMSEDSEKRKRKEKGKGVVSDWPPPPPKRVSPRLADAGKALENRLSSRVPVQAHPRSVEGATPAAKTRSQNRRRNQRSENAMYNGRAMCSPSYLLVKPPKNIGDGDGEANAKVSVHRSKLAKSVLNEECELVKIANDVADDSEVYGREAREANAEAVSLRRSELAKSVLGLLLDEAGCELVENHDYGNRTCNTHEEVLFECETIQYDCDMMWKMLEETMKSFMNYYWKLQGPNNEQLPSMEELLSGAHKTCIQRMYKKGAKKVIEATKENPTKVLPILINELVLKLEELKRLKAKTTPMWVQAYINNFHLSLN